MNLVTTGHVVPTCSGTGRAPMRVEEIVKGLEIATGEVFATMMGMEVASGDAAAERAATGPTDSVVSLIGLSGAWIGTGSLACGSTTACRLASQFLMAQLESVNDEVLDVVAELTNMIFGGFKNTFEEIVGPMDLSIPSVIFGRSFTTRSAGESDWIHIPFHCGEDHFDVHICLAPNRCCGQTVGKTKCEPEKDGGSHG